MRHRTAWKIDPVAGGVCAALLVSLGACSADEPPAVSDASAPAAQAPLRVAVTEPPANAVAEPPAASVPAPAADAPVQQPLSSAPPPSPVATLAATAELQPTEGNTAHGTVEFYLAQPTMALNVSLEGLKPGNHGFHVHENGDCSGVHAEAAGAHLNPNGTPHGDPKDADQRHHAGDLGNLRAEDDGTAKQWLRTEDLQLQGPAGIVGKAIVVHASDDDLKSQPAGESGEPIACGVIKAVTW
jgi:superoxide dismutase, Cu-Zn family